MNFQLCHCFCDDPLDEYKTSDLSYFLIASMTRNLGTCNGYKAYGVLYSRRKPSSTPPNSSQFGQPFLLLFPVGADTPPFIASAPVC